MSLLQSDEEALKGIVAWGTFRLFPDCLGLLADYDGPEPAGHPRLLAASVIEQADALSAFQDETYSQSPALYQGGRTIGANHSDEPCQRGDGVRRPAHTQPDRGASLPR